MQKNIKLIVSVFFGITNIDFLSINLLVKSAKVIFDNQYFLIISLVVKQY